MIEAAVCVVGGGPAGSTVARRLAELGHAVVLVERATFPRRRIGESLPPSILPVLDALGLRAEVERSAVLRSHGAVVDWGERGYKPYGEPGFQVDRGRFDDLLLRAAQHRGVRVIQPARAGRPHRTADGWDLPLGDGRVIRARAWVDASGRRPPRARRPHGLPGAPRTLAVWGYWRGVPQDRADACIEAARDGWSWSAPLPDGSVNAAVFVALQAGAALDYRARLASSPLLRRCLDGALDGPIHACDATPYADDDPIGVAGSPELEAAPAGSRGPAYLRVGDASYAIDPLSSQGVQHALASALQGAVALHTLLVAPADGEAAIEFYRTRQADAFAASARTAAALYARERRFVEQPFWAARAGAPVATAPPPPRAALRPDRPLRLGDAVRIAETPVLIGDRIRRVRALHHPLLARPTAFLGDVPLAPLAAQLAGRTAAELAQRWPARALAWLWHTGLVEEQ
jgi:flavin-dependent dehydrogenase